MTPSNPLSVAEREKLAHLITNNKVGVNKDLNISEDEALAISDALSGFEPRKAMMGFLVGNLITWTCLLACIGLLVLMSGEKRWTVLLIVVPTFALLFLLSLWSYRRWLHHPAQDRAHVAFNVIEEMRAHPPAKPQVQWPSETDSSRG